MKNKSLREFIREHREEIDQITKSPYHNDEERRQCALSALLNNKKE